MAGVFRVAARSGLYGSGGCARGCCLPWSWSRSATGSCAQTGELLPFLRGLLRGPGATDSIYGVFGSGVFPTCSPMSSAFRRPVHRRGSPLGAAEGRGGGDGAAADRGASDREAVDGSRSTRDGSTPRAGWRSTIRGSCTRCWWTCGPAGRLGAAYRIFEATLQAAKGAGLVGRRRVLDSTPLYDAVATMDTVTMVRSAIRGLLRAADGDRRRSCGVVAPRRRLPRRWEAGL